MDSTSSIQSFGYYRLRGQGITKESLEGRSYQVATQGSEQPHTRAARMCCNDTPGPISLSLKLPEQEPCEGYMPGPVLGSRKPHFNNTSQNLDGFLDSDQLYDIQALEV